MPWNIWNRDRADSCACVVVLEALPLPLPPPLLLPSPLWPASSAAAFAASAAVPPDSATTALRLDDVFATNTCAFAAATMATQTPTPAETPTPTHMYVCNTAGATTTKAQQGRRCLKYPYKPIIPKADIHIIPGFP